MEGSKLRKKTKPSIPPKPPLRGSRVAREQRSSITFRKTGEVTLGEE